MKSYFYSIIIIIIISCIFIGCNAFESINYPNEDLVVKGGFDGSWYIYSDKVNVHLSYKAEDNLIIKTDEESNWETNGYVVLNGDFKKVAWNNNCIFIYMDYYYYVFDIDAYEVGEYITNSNDIVKKIPKFELKKYSIDEMEKIFPDYQSYEWYDH